MIRSTFSGFTMAQLALQYNQKGLDVAGQNATNARTPGYTRQRLDMMSMNLSGLSGFYMTGANPNIGFGVELTGVSQLRDKFIDIQYRDQSAKLAATEAINHIQALIGDVFDETDKKAIAEQLSKVRSVLSNYSTHVGETEHEGIVRSEFQSLINLLYRNHVDLQKSRMDLQPSEDGQSTMSLDMARVNDILKSIARISKQITMSRTLGNPALEMLDQRNLLIDELSTYLPITVKYTDKISATEPNEKSAFVDYITITLNDGDKDPKNDIVLLQESQYNIKARDDGHGNLILDSTGDKDIGDTLYFRQIGAEVMQKGSKAKDGTTDISGKTKLYISGIDADGTGIPNTGTLNKGIYTVQSENIPKVFNTGTGVELYDVSGVYEGYNNSKKAVAQGKLKGILDMVNKEGPFDKTNVNGFGYYEKSLDLLVDKMVRVFNSLNTPEPLPTGKTDRDYLLFDAEVPANTEFVKDVTLTSEIRLKKDDVIPAGTVFEKDTVIDGTTYHAGVALAVDVTLLADATLPEGTKIKAGKKLNATIRTHSLPFTANNVRISDAWRIGKNHLTASKEANPGSKQNENILAMIAAMDAKRGFDFKTLSDGSVYTTNVGEAGGIPLFKGSLQEYYTNISVTLGVDKRSTDSLKKSQSSVKDAIAFNKDQVSGVDTNEETVAMIQYNKAYSAAARVMTAMDEMLETLMNTGRVGR